MHDSRDPSKYEICFIRSDAENVTENLKLAFDEMDTNHLEPIWVTESACLQITKKEPKLFVLDPFEGPSFDHLNNLQCRIIGPLAILYCLQYGDTLPKRPHPVYSVSMRKITVSCSNINSNMREDIQKKVQLMGGLFSKDLTKSVTHLVVGEVRSKKYQVAASFKLPIMLPQWIDEIWTNGQYKRIHASDSLFNSFKCPVFKGLVITVSQLSAEERSAIQTLVKENGGVYLPALKAQETTHLILSEPTGDKYRYAVAWKVFCIKVRWIYDSIETGYCRDENLYKIDENTKPKNPKQSTPNRDTTCNMPPVDCSMINNLSVMTHLDETISSEVSLPAIPKKSSLRSSLDAFDLGTLPKDDQFLDGCKIFLSGLSQKHVEKLNRIINAGGGMRFGKYSDSVSHVVCGDISDSFIQSLKSSSVKPHIVNPNWLLECYKSEKLVDVSPFLCIEASVLSPEKTEVDDKKQLNNSASASQTSQNSTSMNNFIDIFKQYLNEPSADEKSSKAVSEVKNVSSKGSETFNVAGDGSDSEEGDIAKLFEGMKFVIVGFAERDHEILREMIQAHSGIVPAAESEKDDCIAVVPIIYRSLDIKSRIVITNCWIQKCIDDCTMYAFDENELFKPVKLVADAKPFESFVVTISQYSGTERDCLTHLIEMLGATCQECFIRKANKNKGLLSNTHLVVATPEGSKYEAAKKWKIPAVTKQWVLEAAVSGLAPPLENYFVDILWRSNISNENKDVSNVRSGTTLRSSISNEDKDVSNMKPSTAVRLNNSIENKEVSNVAEKGTALLNNADFEFATPLPTKKNIAEPLAKNVPWSSPAQLSKDIRNAPKGTPKMECSMNSTMDESLDLDMNKSYKYKFRVSGILNDLDSSCGSQMSETPRRESAIIEDMFHRNLTKAEKYMDVFFQSPAVSKSESKIEEIQDFPPGSVEKEGVLKGVTVFVSKKLSHLQRELHDIVSDLSGDYLFVYDATCSHFVFSGKLNDLTKEFREARSQGKIIVAPEWIYACKAKNLRLDEKLYPHTLKPNMSLANDISIAKKEEKTPSDKSAEEPSTKDVPVTDFNKQLNDILEAAKSAKRRQSKRNMNSFSSSPSTPASPANNLPRQISDSFIKKLEKPEEDTSGETQDTQSQTCPIMWDDPMGRMERERIAAIESGQVPAVKSQSMSKLSLPNMSKVVKPSTSKTSDDDCIIEEIVVKNSKGRRNTTSPKKSSKSAAKIFMFSTIADAKKELFTEIIQALGGHVSEFPKCFDLAATHLILEKPLKNEKFLSSVASGKWIVHPEFLMHSKKIGHFANEEDFEWGGPSTSKFVEDLPSSSKKIAFSPHRWRLKLAKDSLVKGAFCDWKVILYGDDKAKLSTYTKILQAGGADIQPLDGNHDQLTHVIVDMKKRSQSQIDFSQFVSSGVKCIKPDYLAFYLIEDPPPDINNYMIQEAKDLMNLAETSLKRRNLSVGNRGSKRSRNS